MVPAPQVCWRLLDVEDASDSRIPNSFQVVSDPAPALATAVNGGSDAAYPPTLPAQMQRNNNFRPPRPAGVGNGRPGPPPAAGSYSRERDSERGSVEVLVG